MAAKLLLPGFGGMYTSETFDNNNTLGIDTIDCSHCAQLALQVHKVSAAMPGAGTFQLTQSFDGTTFANLGTTLATTTDGAVLLYDVTDGPFGVIKIKPASIDTAGTVNATLTGWPIQTIW